MIQEKLSDRVGKPTRRIDGVAKVTGAARYASDEPVTNPAYAYLVTSSIARGSITAFKLERARAVRGVLDILTHENVGSGFKDPLGPDGNPTTETLETNRIWHDGQIIAIVVAETYEAAREAANKVEVVYAQEAPSATFDAPGVETKAHKPQKGLATQRLLSITIPSSCSQSHAPGRAGN
jgi:xanthine dehydrogenase YagR molybdenum-binding subunit